LTQYVDTSILAAYYCPEPLSERAEQRLRELRPPTISWLTGVELHSALAKKVRMNELAEGQQRDVVRRKRRHTRVKFEHLPLFDSTGLQKMAARRPELAKRPKFILSEPDSVGGV
jgi:predicted nucleic acid-binding protein